MYLCKLWFGQLLRLHRHSALTNVKLHWLGLVFEWVIDSKNIRADDPSCVTLHFKPLMPALEFTIYAMS